MKEIELKTCPYCGGQQIVEAHLSTYGGATIEKGAVKGSGLHILLCKDCGSILRAYVTKTEKF